MRACRAAAVAAVVHFAIALQRESSEASLSAIEPLIPALPNGLKLEDVSSKLVTFGLCRFGSEAIAVAFGAAAAATADWLRCETPARGRATIALAFTMRRERACGVDIETAAAPTLGVSSEHGIAGAFQSLEKGVTESLLHPTAGVRLVQVSDTDSSSSGMPGARMFFL